MKKMLLLGVLATGFASSAHAASTLVINELYTGGGSSVVGTTYTRDFVELYNNSLVPVNLAGYSLQYFSAAGTTPGTIVNFGVGSIIGANSYLSVATGSAGAAGATLAAGTGAGFVNYVAPTTSASLSNSGGAVRLIDASANVVDLVGFGSVTVAALRVEGATAAPAPTNTTTSLNRTAFGDTDLNSADFTNSTTPTPTAGLLSLVVVPEPTTLAALAGVALTAVRRRRA